VLLGTNVVLVSGGGGGATGDLCTGAGGGGSEYAAASMSATLTAGVRCGNGEVSITYPAPTAHATHTRPPESRTTSRAAARATSAG
jgi:hypothetical protein